MPLTLKRMPPETLLADYRVMYDGHEVGWIYHSRNYRPEVAWICSCYTGWGMHGGGGHFSSLEEAKTAFRKAWDARQPA